MAADVMNLLSTAISASASWFHRIITSAGVSGIMISMFVVWASVKYLLGPLIFSAGSDKAKAKREDDK